MSDADEAESAPEPVSRVDPVGPGGDEPSAFLSALVAALPAYVVRFDDQLRILYVSREQPGYPPEHFVGRPALDFIPPGDHEQARRCVREAWESGEPRSYETLGPGPGGGWAPYHVIVTPIRRADGRREGCFVALDTSTLRRQERAIEDSERRLRIALTATGLGLWTWDLATNEVLWDDRMRAAMGREHPLTLPEYVSVAVHPEDRPLVEGGGARAMASGRFEPVAHRVLRPDGEVRWMLTVGEIEMDASGKPVRLMGGNLDVTEQRRLEEELRHAQKLEAVGRLTAGVAHNFNNMLMALLPSIELLREVVPASHLELIDDALGTAERAADLVRKLMTFAGQRRARTSGPCDLSALVHRVAAMCQRTFGPAIVLAAEDVAPGVLVATEEADLEQVLMNLLLNARDAVNDAGRPLARIEVALRLGATTAGGEVEGRHAVLSVRDDGTGMSEEALQHLFVPFFTSKGVGRGTGLGLATSYAVARGLGGRIDVDSTPDRGTTVSVVLPTADAPRAKPESIRPSQRAPGRARVLLVDDEPLVRKVIPEVLALEGCDVRAVGDADAAREEARREPPDVFLLDRSLPGGGGPNLLEELRELAPGARFVWFTGQDVSPEEGALADAIVLKPVRGAELARVLAELLRS